MNTSSVGLDPQALGLRSDFRRADTKVEGGALQSSALFSANLENPTVIEYDAGKLNDVSAIAQKVLSNIGT